MLLNDGIQHVSKLRKASLQQTKLSQYRGLPKNGEGGWRVTVVRYRCGIGEGRLPEVERGSLMAADSVTEASFAGREKTGGVFMVKYERPSDEEIATRAHQLYVESDCESGHDIDNWLQAEYELMHLPVRELANLPDPQKGEASRKSIVELVRAAMF